MNDYERLLERVKGLGAQLYQDSMSAYHAMNDSLGEARHFYDGQSVGYDHAKERVEKIIEEFPNTIHGIPDRLISTDLLEESQ